MHTMICRKPSELSRVYLGFSLQSLDWCHNFHRSQINNVQHSCILCKKVLAVIHGIQLRCKYK